MTKLLAAALIIMPVSAFAQGTQTLRPTGSQQYQRPGTVLTQPSNNPFVNPIQQGVPPAAQTQRVRKPRAER